MNLPNALTVTRIFLVPLLVVVLLTQFEGRNVLGLAPEIVGAAIFAVASLTDWADGYLARRRKQITPLGQVIDPLADKLLTSAALISLVQMEMASAWIVALIIGREFAVTANSRPMISATIQALAISICTSEMSAADVSSLSASGSITCPSGVICLRRRAR